MTAAEIDRMVAYFATVLTLIHNPTMFDRACHYARILHEEGS